MRSLKKYEQDWTFFGEQDPLWAVLTEENKKDKGWDHDDFFSKGEQEINAVLAHVSNFIPTWEKRKALDFGCGVGRLTQALAGCFEEVMGVDISTSMIKHARSLNLKGECVQYIHNAEDNLEIFKDEEFDFIYSNITLQHISPEFAEEYIREFTRVLSPGGIIVFQIPSRPVKLLHRFLYRFFRKNWYQRKREKAHPLPIMEMHAIPRHRVEDIFLSGGVNTIDVVRDEYAGKNWLSLKYYGLKPKHNIVLQSVERKSGGIEGEEILLTVLLKNDGSDVLSNVTEKDDIKLGARLYEQQSSFVKEPIREFRTSLPSNIPVGEDIEIPFRLDIGRLPSGRYKLDIDIVSEHRYWFSQIGFHSIVIPIRLKCAE